MLIATDGVARAALQGVADMRAEVRLMRDENSEQHEQARNMITQGMDRLNDRLNLIIGGGFGALVGIVAYLLVYGAPWVTKEEYKSDLNNISGAVQELRGIHQKNGDIP